MIWRDDDVGVGTRMESMIAVDDIFQRYGMRHTIAVVAEKFDTRPDLIEFIASRKMDVQLHCWAHTDLRYKGQEDLERAVDMLYYCFGKRPTVLYPPWNRSDEGLEKAAANLGMTVSYRKISLSQFIRAGGDVSESVVNFHHWAPEDVLQIEPAFRVALYCQA